jgi:hypothetical protein
LFGEKRRKEKKRIGEERGRKDKKGGTKEREGEEKGWKRENIKGSRREKYKGKI